MPTTVDSQARYLSALIEKFPTFDPGWDHLTRDHWLACYKLLWTYARDMDAKGVVPPPRPPPSEAAPPAIARRRRRTFTIRAHVAT